MDILVVVDMQNDFIDGALGTKEAVAIVPKVVEKIERNLKDDIFIPGTPIARTTWIPRKAATFRFPTASREPRDGNFIRRLKRSEKRCPLTSVHLEAMR